MYYTFTSEGGMESKYGMCMRSTVSSVHICSKPTGSFFHCNRGKAPLYGCKPKSKNALPRKYVSLICCVMQCVAATSWFDHPYLDIKPKQLALKKLWFLGQSSLDLTG